MTKWLQVGLQKVWTWFLIFLLEILWAEPLSLYEKQSQSPPATQTQDSSDFQHISNSFTDLELTRPPRFPIQPVEVLGQVHCQVITPATDTKGLIPIAFT